jgi:hypothetical protein
MDVTTSNRTRKIDVQTEIRQKVPALKIVHSLAPEQSHRSRWLLA